VLFNPIDQPARKRLGQNLYRAAGYIIYLTREIQIKDLPLSKLINNQFSPEAGKNGGAKI